MTGDLGKLDWPRVIDEAVRSLRFELQQLPGGREPILLTYAAEEMLQHAGHDHAATAMVEIHKLLCLPFDRHEGLFPWAARRVSRQRANLDAALRAGVDPSLPARIYARGLGELLKIMVEEGGHERVLAWGVMLTPPEQSRPRVVVRPPY